MAALWVPRTGVQGMKAYRLIWNMLCIVAFVVLAVVLLYGALLAPAQSETLRRGVTAPTTNHTTLHPCGPS